MDVVKQRTPSTVADVVEDVERTERTEEEESQQQREREERRPKSVSSRSLAQLLGLLEQARHIAQDCDPNNDRVMRFLQSVSVASSIYEPLHRELAQKSRQALISAFFARRAAEGNVLVQPRDGEVINEEQALEEHSVDDVQMSDDEADEVASIVSDADFGGF